MTNKTRNIILIGSYIAMITVMFGMLYYDSRYHEDDTRWSIGMIVLLFVLLFLWINVLPRFLEMRVDNHHKVSTRNERLVFNGKEKGRIRWIYSLVFTFVFMFSYKMWDDFRKYPSSSIGATIGACIVFASVFMLCMSPLYGDMIYRCFKNTYTIEGSNLIIDEWAWFRKKTDHLVIPISEIESIRKKNNGLVQACNIEIQVQGIKRVLATGVVGDQLYNALKERMA